jgi:tetratricopeptide (TPR) repeat protein
LKRRWIVEGEIGRGGMGVVFRARDAATGELAALKRLRPQEAHPELLARFEREGKAALAIQHANVVRLLDWGQEEGAPCLVFELVPGGSLAERVRREGPLPWRDAVALAADVARGLHAVHLAGLVHRDVKPANILLSGSGAKVSDLGLVRRAEGLEQSRALTVEGEVVGTPQFLPPEQVLGRPVTAQTDLYGLGATLHYALTAASLFEGDAISLMQKHLEQRPVPPSRLVSGLPREVDRLVLRLLEKEPGTRGASAAAVAQELDALASRGTGKARWRALAVLPIALVVGLLLLVPRREAPATTAAPPSAPRVSSWLLELRAKRDALEKTTGDGRARAASELASFLEREAPRLDVKDRAPDERSEGIASLASFTALWLLREGASPEDSDRAESFSSRLIELAPGPRFLPLRARVSFRRQRYTEVLETCERAAPLGLELRAIRALSLASLGRRADARAEVADLHDAALESSIEGRARCFEHCEEAQRFEVAGDGDRALAAYDRAVEADPGSGDAHHMRGLVRGALEDKTGAFEDYSFCYATRSPMAAFAVGNRGVLQKDVHAALEDLDTGIRLDPGFAVAYYFRAQLRIKNGLGLEPALEDLEKAEVCGRERRRSREWMLEVAAVKDQVRRRLDGGER